MHLRLQPIRVFCLHHISERFDPVSMYEGDWTDIEWFKKEVTTMLRQGYHFISLSDAYDHICSDTFRIKKYAVLTFDDGFASIKEVLPWLLQNQIPTTLFINGKYLDGVSYRETANERYLTYEDLWLLNDPLIEIAHHGWEHNDITHMTDTELERSIKLDDDMLSSHPRYIPFWAYTYGRHTAHNNDILLAHHLITVFMDGMKNYNDSTCIHRELLK